MPWLWRGVNALIANALAGCRNGLDYWYGSCVLAIRQLAAMRCYSANEGQGCAPSPYVECLAFERKELVMKHAYLLPLSVLAIALMAGCGQKEGSSSSPSDQQATPPASPSAPLSPPSSSEPAPAPAPAPDTSGSNGGSSSSATPPATPPSSSGAAPQSGATPPAQGGSTTPPPPTTPPSSGSGTGK